MARHHPAGRVAITQQATASDNEDDAYEDVEEDDNQSAQSSAVIGQSEGSDGAGNLSMIMEQSYMDTDFNLCLSGIVYASRE